MFITDLSTSERNLFIMYLEKYIPDSQLVSLVEQIQSEREQTRKDMRTCAKTMGENSVSVLLDKPTIRLLPPETEEAPIPKLMTAPPGDAAARITSASQTIIIECIKTHSSTAEQINSKLKGTLINTKRLLKLLWLRNLVVFDGDNYFLA